MNLILSKQILVACFKGRPIISPICKIVYYFFGEMLELMILFYLTVNLFDQFLQVLNILLEYHQKWILIKCEWIYLKLGLKLKIDNNEFYFKSRNKSFASSSS